MDIAAVQYDTQRVLVLLRVGLLEIEHCWYYISVDFSTYPE